MLVTEGFRGCLSFEAYFFESLKFSSMPTLGDFCEHFRFCMQNMCPSTEPGEHQYLFQKSARKGIRAVVMFHHFKATQ